MTLTLDAWQLTACVAVIVVGSATIATHCYAHGRFLGFMDGLAECERLHVRHAKLSKQPPPQPPPQSPEASA